MTWDYRPFSDPDDFDPFWRVMKQAFNGPDELRRVYLDRIGVENVRTLLRGSDIVGGCARYRMGQWFGGQCLDCAGVSLVGVSPHVRGQGAARFMMQQQLRELYDEGTPIASLFPSTQRLYRSAGYEQAGHWCRHELPLANIGRIDSPLPIVPVAINSSAPFAAAAQARARVSNGNLRRTDGLWQRLLDVHQKQTHAFVFGAESDPEGYIIYYQDDGPPLEDDVLKVSDMCANTPDAAHALWSFLSGHRSMISKMAWRGPASDPLLFVPQEPRTLRVIHDRWMLRIVNVPAALSLRGYPPGTNGELHLDVTDVILPENSNRYILTVDAGRATVKMGGDGTLKTDISGLAPLFSALYTPRQLCMLGMVDATEEAIQAATRLFAGPEPWMSELF